MTVVYRFMPCGVRTPELGAAVEPAPISVDHGAPALTALVMTDLT